MRSTSLAPFALALAGCPSPPLENTDRLENLEAALAPLDLDGDGFDATDAALIADLLEALQAGDPDGLVSDVFKADAALAEAGLSTATERQELANLMAGLVANGTAVYFDGVDLHVEGGNVFVRSAGGDGDVTASDVVGAFTVNGKGNLVIGWNESPLPAHDKGSAGLERTGDHNLVIGSFHDWDSSTSLIHGGDPSIVTSGHWVRGTSVATLGGSGNIITDADGAVAIGGELNAIQPAGIFGVCVGGENNSVGGIGASVVGGRNNVLHPAANYSVAVAGLDHEISSSHGAIVAGQDNTLTADLSAMAGGFINSSGGANWAFIGGQHHVPAGQVSSCENEGTPGPGECGVP